MNEEQLKLYMRAAKAAHEANRAYCIGLGDFSQPSWETAPDWQKNSAIEGVKFHAQNPDAPPSASHESWLEEKKRDGWKYGPVKNPDKKEHPCFVPFDELPIAQQMKDVIFSAVVQGILSIESRTQQTKVRSDEQNFKIGERVVQRFQNMSANDVLKLTVQAGIHTENGKLTEPYK